MLATTTGVSVQLPQFEGPLALLLYLIRKEEMDIFDIPIHRITAQYLDYIKLMKELDLEVAGEFISMAASLIQLKSRMLLPRYNDAGEIIEEEDPRKELVQKLLEYQKFQDAAKVLNERTLLGRDVWPRGQKEKFEAPEEEILLEDNALFSLISAYRKAMTLFKRKIHKVANKTQSIASRILEIKDRLLIGRQVSLSGLITAVENKRVQVLITFLSALELAKMGFVKLFQSDTYQEIYLEATKPIAGDAISKVEEYESHQPEGVSALAAAALGSESRESQLETTATEQLEFQLPDHDFAESSDENLPLEDAATDEEILAAEAELDAEMNASAVSVKALNLIVEHSPETELGEIDWNEKINEENSGGQETKES